jgi:hypothetical protein
VQPPLVPIRKGLYFVELSRFQVTGEPALTEAESAEFFRRVRESAKDLLHRLQEASGKSEESADGDEALEDLLNKLQATARTEQGHAVIGGRLFGSLFYLPVASPDVFASAFYVVLQASAEHAHLLTATDLELGDGFLGTRSGPPEWFVSLFRSYAPRVATCAKDIDAVLGITVHTPTDSPVFDDASTMRYDMWQYEYELFMEELFGRLNESEAHLLWRLLEVSKIAPPWG